MEEGRGSKRSRRRGGRVYTCIDPRKDLGRRGFGGRSDSDSIELTGDFRGDY